MRAKLKYYDSESSLNYSKLSRNERLGEIFLPDGGTISFIETIPNSGTHDKGTSRYVIELHGHGSHKNALYQVELAQELAKRGFGVIRFDFQGLGESLPSQKEKGRPLSQDVHNIEIVAEELVLKRGHNLYAIVAHSRGALAMFEYALKHEVPRLVNCSARFDGKGLADRCRKMEKDWEKLGGFWSPIRRRNEVVKIWVPMAETMSLVNADTKSYTSINTKTRILSVYGTHDTVVPPETAGHAYSEIFGDRHALAYITNADHNFLGAKVTQTEFPEGVRIKSNRIDLNGELVQIVLEWLTSDLKRSVEFDDYPQGLRPDT